jgi:hypothetical protein
MSYAQSRRRSTFGVFALGFVVALAGDATHVASGTTRYLWDLPAIWRSAIWFPFAVGAAVVLAAHAAERFAPPPHKTHSLAEAVQGAAIVAALYALTAVVHEEPPMVTVTLTAAIALSIALWWDPSPRALATGAAAAILGPLAEIGVVAAGASEYTASADDLWGVAPWLPCLYFAAGAVASGLLRVPPAQWRARH